MSDAKQDQSDGAARRVHAHRTTGYWLLVVVAIMAALATILFPVFASVRERGRRTVCQSNLKQIAVAMQQYVQDCGGIYPPPNG